MYKYVSGFIQNNILYGILTESNWDRIGVHAYVASLSMVWFKQSLRWNRLSKNLASVRVEFEA